MLPVLSYGCETSSLTLREECRLRILDNRVQGSIFGLKKVEVTGKWRKLHNEELYDVQSSLNIMQVTKHRSTRWVWHVARIAKRKDAYRFSVGKPEERRPLGRPGIDGRIILKQTFKKWDGGHGMDRSGLLEGQVAGSCECDTKPSGFIKYGEFPHEELCSMETVMKGCNFSAC
jgi:hypothetical protein